MDALSDRVKGQLERWGLLESAEGAAALDIARRLGRRDLSPTGAAMLHGQLNKVLADLRKLAPPDDVQDDVDELAAAREARRKAAGLE